MERTARGVTTQGGFTLIELVIVIFVLGALMTIAIVQLSNAQNAGRDEERRTDLTSIARKLETLYDANLTYPTTAGLSTAPSLTSTKSGAELITQLTADSDLNQNALYSPGAATNTTTVSIIGATTTTAITPSSPAVYVYQPIASDGTACTVSGTVCTSFTLYALLEANNTVYTVMSKRQ